MSESVDSRAKARNAQDLDALLQQGYRYALSLTHNTARAEDLLQDAWVSILKAHGPWQKGYLFTTIRNRFIDQYRRERLVVIESLEDEDRVEAATDNWQDAMMFRAEMDTVRQALGTLRAEEREALYLSAVEGYTAAEIAEMTQRPRGTVLSMMFRARKKVRAYCQQQEREALP